MRRRLAGGVFRRNPPQALFRARDRRRRLRPKSPAQTKAREVDLHERFSGPRARATAFPTKTVSEYEKQCGEASCPRSFESCPRRQSDGNVHAELASAWYGTIDGTRRAALRRRMQQGPIVGCRSPPLPQAWLRRERGERVDGHRVPHNEARLQRTLLVRELLLLASQPENLPLYLLELVGLRRWSSFRCFRCPNTARRRRGRPRARRGRQQVIASGISWRREASELRSRLVPFGRDLRQGLPQAFNFLSKSRVSVPRGFCGHAATSLLQCSHPVLQVPSTLTLGLRRAREDM